MSNQIETISEYLNFTVVFRKIDEEERIIAGYANVGDIVDNQNELIPIPALKRAWDKFWKGKDFATINLMHSNISVGKVIEGYKEKDGTMHKSGVDDTGLYIVAKLREDIKKAIETWDMIKRGVLKAFSIAGEALKRTVKCEGNNCFRQIDDMELHEISIVDTPANEPSTFTILKRDEDVMEDDFPEKIVLVEDFAKYEIEFEDEDLESLKAEWIQKGLWHPDDFDENGFSKKVLTAEARAKVKSFACTTASGEKKLPIHDAAHVRNAMARYNQAQGCQTASVKAKICRAAKKFGIESTNFCGTTKKSMIIGKPFAGFKDFNACVRETMRKNPKYTKEQAQGTCAKIHHQATGKYPSQKSDSVSYDLCLLRSPVQRESTLESRDSLLNQTEEASERTLSSDENVGSRTKISLGDINWAKLKLKSKTEAK